jgi:hypothetical protein
VSEGSEPLAADDTPGLDLEAFDPEVLDVDLGVSADIGAL